MPNRPDQGRRRTKTRSKTRAAVRGLYIGENGKADPSPTFANGASGFGMTTAMTENREQRRPLRGLQLAKGGRKQAGQRIFAWASE